MREWKDVRGAPTAGRLSEGRRISVVRSNALLQDGASHPELRALACLGSFGAETGKGHIHSQLTKKYLSNCSAPSAECVRVPAVDPHTHALTYSDCYIMAPHDWIGWLCNDFHDEFLQMFAPGQSLHTFWSNTTRTSQSNRARLGNFLEYLF